MSVCPSRLTVSRSHGLTVSRSHGLTVSRSHGLTALPVLRRHLPFRHPHRTAVLHGTDALKAGWGKSKYSDLQRVAGADGDLLPKQHDGFVEGVTLHDSGLANRFRAGADGALIL